MMRRLQPLLAATLAGVVAGIAPGMPSAADGEPSPALTWNCAGCHGPDGASVGTLLPSIAGMDPRYFMRVMRHFGNDERFSTVMGRIARGYGTLELRAMAFYFTDQDWVPAGVTADATVVDAGRAIHDEHCVECHEEDGRYQDKEIPRLAGQWPAYLLAQLQDYRAERGPMPQPDKMRERVAELSDADLAALSAFYGQVDADLGTQDGP